MSPITVPEKVLGSLGHDDGRLAPWALPVGRVELTVRGLVSPPSSTEWTVRPALTVLRVELMEVQ